MEILGPCRARFLADGCTIELAANNVSYFRGSAGWLFAHSMIELGCKRRYAAALMVLDWNQKSKGHTCCLDKHLGAVVVLHVSAIVLKDSISCSVHATALRSHVHACVPACVHPLTLLKTTEGNGVPRDPSKLGQCIFGTFWQPYTLQYTRLLEDRRIGRLLHKEWMKIIYNF